MLDLRQQMEEMTNSLTNSDIAATPNSVQSLNFDNSRTPTAPMTPATPTNHQDTKTPEKDLKIDLQTPKPRPEYLSSLTKLAMKTEPPKFHSTPLKTTLPIVENKHNEPLTKGVVFKTKHLSKHNLKPLDLKMNLNNINLDRNDNRNGSAENTPVDDNTPVANIDKVFPIKMEKDKTPVSVFCLIYLNFYLILVSDI